jgi:hypothetical protein
MLHMTEKRVVRNWTDADAEIIRTLITDGKTYGQIGELLGATRNSIAGAADRFGIRANKVTKRPNTHVARPKAMREIDARIAAQARAQAKADLLTAPKSGDGTPLLDLKSRQCRWPVAEDATGLTLFCGEQTSEISAPWCPHHHALAYRAKIGG